MCGGNTLASYKINVYTYVAGMVGGGGGGQDDGRMELLCMNACDCLLD